MNQIKMTIEMSRVMRDKVNETKMKNLATARTKKGYSKKLIIFLSYLNLCIYFP